MTDTATDTIDYTVTEGRAEIVLDRPDILNALDDPTVEALTDAVEAAMDDSDVYAVVLTGRGRGFCSGADVTGMPDRDPSKAEFRNHIWKFQNAVRSLHECSKPTIAAVNGPAVGAGCDLALGCDLRVMSEESMLRQQFVGIGLVPAEGGGWLLPQLIGTSKAKEYIYTNRDITPEDAEELGLVVDVVPAGNTLEVARSVADEIRQKPAMAVRRTKRLLGEDHSLEEYFDAAFEHQWQCIHDDEHREAVTALNEGRDPSFDRSVAESDRTD